MEECHLHTLVALPPGKQPPHLFDRALDAPQSRSGHSGEGKIPVHAENRTLVFYPVAVANKAIQNA
jgi:hypothetical protein